MTAATVQATTRRPVLKHALVVMGLIFTAYVLFVAAPAKHTLAIDVTAYWHVNLANPYTGTYGDVGFFPYSPPIALLLQPITWLPWPAFVAVWYSLLIGAVVWLGRREFLVLLAFPPVAFNLADGNIHLLLAVAIVLGFRYPQAWAFMLLTKVTPGIGLLWFVARREWRNLALALGATAAIVGVSAIFMPTQWRAWIDMLLSTAGTPTPPSALPVPLMVRLPVAAAIVWWGARTDRRWTVPLAAALALPVVWPGGFAILAAWWRLRPSADNYHAPDVLRSHAWARFVPGAVRSALRPDHGAGVRPA